MEKVDLRKCVAAHEKVLKGNGNVIEQLAVAMMMLIQIRGSLLMENGNSSELSVVSRRSIQEFVYLHAAEMHNAGALEAEDALLRVAEIMPTAQNEAMAALYKQHIMQSAEKSFVENNNIQQKTYVIADKDSDLVKIGRSHDVMRRLRQLSSQSGRDLQLMIIINSDVESDLHDKFRHLRTRGEWFEDPNKEIIKSFSIQ